MNIPNDPVMLLSVINTQLRDHYPSLDEFCLSCDIDREKICEKLASIDYVYDPAINQFI
ncbi:MAG: DUF4250 domain-containing protein [Coprococcus sp.]